MNATAVDDLTDYRSLALAGIVLSAELVRGCAHGSRLDPAAVSAVKRAIGTAHAETFRAVFGDIADYRGGVVTAIALLEGKPSNSEPLRYALQLIELASLLRRTPEVVTSLGSALDRLPAEPTDQDLAKVYQSSISTLGKRIQVTGNPELLRQEGIADSIRALLLGGIRFAWLWHQLGGRRWHLVLKRGEILRALKALDTVLQSTLH